MGSFCVTSSSVVDFGEPVNKYACLCSAHFEDSCFTSDPSINLEGIKNGKMKRYLIQGSVTTRQTVEPPSPEVHTERKKEAKGKLN